MDSAAEPSAPDRNDWNWLHLAALLGGNVALAFGPLLVRLTDTGPVAAGFWRLTLALPVLVLLALANRQPLLGYRRSTWLAIGGAALFFAFDLASWHVGIGTTRLGNATLFGNAGSLILMVWGLLTLRRAPSGLEWLSLGAAVTGAGILFGRSLEVSTATLIGDLFCLLAGFLYAFYILLLQAERARIESWALLFWSSLFGAPVLLAIALLRGEAILPQYWWPLLTLALTSQVIGQGLLVYALKHFRPLIVGLVLLTQPAVSILNGWVFFREALTAWDALGMVLVAGALVLARAGEKG